MGTHGIFTCVTSTRVTSTRVTSTRVTFTRVTSTRITSTHGTSTHDTSTHDTTSSHGEREKNVDSRSWGKVSYQHSAELSGRNVFSGACGWRLGARGSKQSD